MVLYTQPGCGQCKMVHTLLDARKIKYEECQDIELMKTKGIDHTPAIEVEKEFTLEDGTKEIRLVVLKAKEMMDYIKGLK